MTAQQATRKTGFHSRKIFMCKGSGKYSCKGNDINLIEESEITLPWQPSCAFTTPKAAPLIIPRPLVSISYICRKTAVTSMHLCTIYFQTHSLFLCAVSIAVFTSFVKSFQSSKLIDTTSLWRAAWSVSRVHASCLVVEAI